jgi:hypothetical protein
MNRLFGGLLLAAGILMMTGSGVCSLAVIVLALKDFTPIEGGFDNWMAPLWALLAMAVGGGFFFLGFAMYKTGGDMGARPNDADEE